MLSRNKKKQAEDIAWRNFKEASSHYKSNPSEKRRLAREWTQQDLDALKHGFGRQYGNVIASILISLMLKFAFKMIERWIEKKLDEVM